MFDVYLIMRGSASECRVMIFLKSISYVNVRDEQMGNNTYVPCAFCLHVRIGLSILLAKIKVQKLKVS